MITQKKLAIYKKYEGQVDGWARVGSPEERSEMSDDDWFLIDDLIQDIII